MTRITPLVGQVLAKARIVGLVAAAVVLTAGTAQAVVTSGDPTPVGDEIVVVDEPTDPATSGGEDPIPVVDDDPPVVVDEDPPVVVDEDPPVVVDEDPPVVVEEPPGEPTDPACTDAVNHGAYVSSVAHATPSGPGKGAIVSAAAHSDCGKPGADVVDDPTGEDPLPVVDESTATTTTKTHGSSGKSAAGHGKGHEKTHGPSATHGNGHGFGSDHGKGHVKTHGKQK